MNKEQMIEQEFIKDFPFGSKAEVGSYDRSLFEHKLEAYKAGRLKTIEEKDKEIEELKLSYQNLTDQFQLLADKIIKRDARIKELEDGLREILEVQTAVGCEDEIKPIIEKLLK